MDIFIEHCIDIINMKKNKENNENKENKPIKVVFDLDYVLVSNICLVDSKPNNFDKILQNVGEDSVIESCGYYFYLYNGWKELIKYVRM